MKPLSCLSLAVFLFVMPRQLCADLEVILKSGTSLVGAVSIDGSDVVVQIGDKALRVPLKDVATIATENSSHEQQAHRLLFMALEARVMGGSDKEVVALLAEAKRLAPEDPSIAFWCASTLVDAGYGKAANEIFVPRREAIAKTYPGMADQLAKRIKRRMEMEKMPEELVRRVDELNAIAAKQPPFSEKRQMFATFRVVDQHKQPIEQSAFRIESRGEEEHVDSYDDGYFLLTFGRYRNNQDEPKRLELIQPGLESKSFLISAASDRVADAGEFVVLRLDEKSKRPFKIRVVGTDGNGISNAKISLQIVTQQGNVANETAAGTNTDLEGRAELQIFPMKYTYRVTADGFDYQNGSIELAAGDRKDNEQKVVLHRAIHAKIRVAWSSTGIQGGPGGFAGAGGTTTGEGEVRTTGSAIRGNQYGGDAINWIRANQQKDRLLLQFMPQQWGGPAQFGNANWVRVIETEKGTNAIDVQRKRLEKYKGLDLNKINEYKDKIAAPKAANAPGGYPGSVTVPAEIGNVYVGKLLTRDMHNGQPVELSFKAIVDEMSSNKEPSD